MTTTAWITESSLKLVLLALCTYKDRLHCQEKCSVHIRILSLLAVMYLIKRMPLPANKLLHFSLYIYVLSLFYANTIISAVYARES